VVRFKNREDVRVFRYSQITSAEYNFSKDQRHRLEVQSDQDSVILDLDKKNYKAFLTVFEANTGRKVLADGVLSPIQGLASNGAR
jgi:hypothetical protein